MIGYATRRAQAIITDSECSKRDLMKYFQVPESKIHVIFPAVENPKMIAGTATNHSQTAILEKYGTRQPYILYVGKHHPYKNIHTLVQAYTIHPEVYNHFRLVIGGKQEPRRKTLYETAWKLDQNQHIRFTDFIPDEDLAALYLGASLFVFPSCYEGFGLPPLEAMACGVPTITSNASSLPEVAGDAAIQIDPNDVQGLADAMRAVLTKPALAHSLREKGLKQAQRFSWEHAALQHRQLYEYLSNG
jgi:glycosyltransferase involved in cell wall biosynthesis